MAELDNPRLQALRNLSSQLPVASSRVASGQQAARDMQLQQAVAAAPQGQNITKAAQQTGAASAANAGQQMVQQAQQNVQQQGQVGSIGLQEQQRQAQSNVAGLQSGLREQQMSNVQRFAQVSEGAKKELYDAQMSFEKDELGRTKFNEIQLADYARTNAQNDEQFRNYAQQAEQLSKRNLQAMDTAYKIASQDLQQKYAQAEQKKDQATMREIADIQKAMAERMQKEKAKAANQQAMWQTGGTIVGGVAGAVFGGPTGAAAGASLGGALGGMAGSQQK